MVLSAATGGMDYKMPVPQTHKAIVFLGI